jgi:hypothetical protein
MKRPLAVISGIMVLVALVYWLEPWPHPAPQPPPAKLTAAQTTPAIRLPAPAKAPDDRPRPVLPRNPLVPGSAPSPIPPIVETADAQTAIDLNKITAMLRDYRTIANENPVGSNAEIMRACMGDNPKHAVLGPPEGLSLNANGELVDRWGTPFFFHQLSKDLMEIRSAGPDRKMWTGDDIVSR